MTKLTNEQIQSILEGAPKRMVAIVIDLKAWVNADGRMFDMDGNLVRAVYSGERYSLAELREILSLRQEVERLRGELSYYADAVDRLEEYTPAQIECDALAHSMRASTLPKEKTND